uniref:TRAF3-interacting protein 1 n=1 Tax=Globodera rostochiensis TaxID=31243 RepID=A0A914I907_GLORO
MDTGRTKELFSALIQRPALTDQLLQRPPFKFIHDIVHETLCVSGYLDGLFTSDELDSTKAGSSRDNKMAFLQKLIDALNMDGHLDDVKPSKIVAGKEAEMTNLLLQSLASESALYVNEKKAVAKKTGVSSSKSKSSSSSKSKDEERRKNSSKKDRGNVKEERSSSKHRSKEKESNKLKTTEQVQEKRKSKNRDAKVATEAEKLSSTDRERRKKRSDSIPRNKTSTSITNSNNVGNPLMDENVLAQQSLDDIYKTDLNETRTTPGRESSGGTSKGGDDSGIAEEMSAESERHEPVNGTPVVGFNSTPEFIEFHPSSSSPTPMVATHSVRPGTAMGRPQTAIGRPGTAIARLAPPKPKKNVISTNNSARDENVPFNDQPQQISLILEENAEKEAQKEVENFLVAEDEEQMFVGVAGADFASEGASVSNLRQGDEHGVLVNRIVENTRMLEEKHLQEDGPFVETDELDVQEQRRVRAEIESVQRVLQRATQNVQPLVRTIEFVSDDFDTMLRELEECRKQSTVLERRLQERATGVSSQVVALGATLRALDSDIRDTREHLARSHANVLKNERKIVTMLDAK